jgi:hypothetical protein
LESHAGAAEAWLKTVANRRRRCAPPSDRASLRCRRIRRGTTDEQAGKAMTIDRMVMAFAGTMVLVSLALAQVHSVYWLLLTAFVGLNLLQASMTRFCPLTIALKRLGVKPGQTFS